MSEQPDNELLNLFAKTKKPKKKIVASRLYDEERKNEERRLRKQKKRQEAQNEPLSTILKHTEEDEDWNNPDDQVVGMDDICLKNTMIKPSADVISDEKNDEPNAQDTARQHNKENAQDKPHNDDDKGSTVSSEDKKAQSWNMIVRKDEDEEEVKSEGDSKQSSAEPEAPAPETASSSAPAAYVPPALRAAMGGSGGGRFDSVKKHKGKHANLPNIEDAEEFPDLGAMGAPQPAPKDAAIDKAKTAAPPAAKPASDDKAPVPPRESSTEDAWTKVGARPDAVPTSTENTPKPSVYVPRHLRGDNPQSTPAPAPSPGAYVPPSRRGATPAAAPPLSAQAPPAKVETPARGQYVPPHLRNRGAVGADSGSSGGGTVAAPAAAAARPYQPPSARQTVAPQPASSSSAWARGQEVAAQDEAKRKADQHNRATNRFALFNAEEAD